MKLHTRIPNGKKKMEIISEWFSAEIFNHLFMHTLCHSPQQLCRGSSSPWNTEFSIYFVHNRNSIRRFTWLQLGIEWNLKIFVALYSPAPGERVIERMILIGCFVISIDSFPCKNSIERSGFNCERRTWKDIQCPIQSIWHELASSIQFCYHNSLLQNIFAEEKKKRNMHINITFERKQRILRTFNVDAKKQLMIEPFLWRFSLREMVRFSLGSIHNNILLFRTVASFRIVSKLGSVELFRN